MRSGRTLAAAALLVTLAVAMGLSYFASGNPDGLEYSADETGFLDAAEDSPTADSPFADYATTGVENTWLSGAITGVVGVAVVLALMGGIAYVVRTRGSADSQAESESDSATATRTG